MGRTIVTDHWRYSEWHDGLRELYDHAADPFEYANLACDPKHSPVGDELRIRLQAGWQAEAPRR